jgi:hypothetical protein
MKKKKVLLVKRGSKKEEEKVNETLAKLWPLDFASSLMDSKDLKQVFCQKNEGGGGSTAPMSQDMSEKYLETSHLNMMECHKNIHTSNFPYDILKKTGCLSYLLRQEIKVSTTCIKDG